MYCKTLWCKRSVVSPLAKLSLKNNLCKTIRCIIKKDKICRKYLALVELSWFGVYPSANIMFCLCWQRIGWSSTNFIGSEPALGKINTLCLVKICSTSSSFHKFGTAIDSIKSPPLTNHRWIWLDNCADNRDWWWERTTTVLCHSTWSASHESHSIQFKFSSLIASFTISILWWLLIRFDLLTEYRSFVGVIIPFTTSYSGALKASTKFFAHLRRFKWALVIGLKDPQRMKAIWFFIRSDRWLWQDWILRP